MSTHEHNEQCSCIKALREFIFCVFIRRYPTTRQHKMKWSKLSTGKAATSKSSEMRHSIFFSIPFNRAECNSKFIWPREYHKCMEHTFLIAVALDWFVPNNIFLWPGAVELPTLTDDMRFILTQHNRGIVAFGCVQMPFVSGSESSHNIASNAAEWVDLFVDGPEFFVQKFRTEIFTTKLWHPHSWVSRDDFHLVPTCIAAEYHHSEWKHKQRWQQKNAPPAWHVYWQMKIFQSVPLYSRAKQRTIVNCVCGMPLGSGSTNTLLQFAVVYGPSSVQYHYYWIFRPKFKTVLFALHIM